jgi:hypothetical protein
LRGIAATKEFEQKTAKDTKEDHTDGRSASWSSCPVPNAGTIRVVPGSITLRAAQAIQIAARELRESAAFA